MAPPRSLPDHGTGVSARSLVNAARLGPARAPSEAETKAAIEEISRRAMPTSTERGPLFLTINDRVGTAQSRVNELVILLEGTNRRVLGWAASDKVEATLTGADPQPPQSQADEALGRLESLHRRLNDLESEVHLLASVL